MDFQKLSMLLNGRINKKHNFDWCICHILLPVGSIMIREAGYKQPDKYRVFVLAPKKVEYRFLSFFKDFQIDRTVSINVGKNRDVYAVAKDIQRRLLQGYAEDFRKAQQISKNRQAKQELLKAKRALIAKPLKAETFNESELFFRGGHVVVGDRYVTFKIDIDFDNAVCIAQAIGEIINKK